MVRRHDYRILLLPPSPLILFCFLCPRSCPRTWSREIRSAVQPRVGKLILHTQTESGAYSRASIFPRAYCDGVASTPWNAIVSVITLLHSDSIQRQDSAGPGPVVSKVSQVALGCCLVRDHIICAPLSQGYC